MQSISLLYLLRIFLAQFGCFLEGNPQIIEQPSLQVRKAVLGKTSQRLKSIYRKRRHSADRTRFVATFFAGSPDGENALSVTEQGSPLEVAGLSQEWRRKYMSVRRDLFSRPLALGRTQLQHMLSAEGLQQTCKGKKDLPMDLPGDSFSLV